MQGSLCLKNGILFVGRHAKTAQIASYDLDGHPLETHFAFKDETLGRSAVSGMSVDDDHRIWVADTPSRRVRAFTLFGKEVVSIGGSADEDDDALGRLGAPVDVCAQGADDALELIVASRGVRRHAVQVLHAESGAMRSLRPLGDPTETFQDARAVDWRGRFLYVCETRAGRVQVFRDLDFHFSFRIPTRGGSVFAPVAVAALDGGRTIVAAGGEPSALLLVDSGGRLLDVIAQGGTADGEVYEPGDIAVEVGDSDRHTRIAVIDCDGDRVQVFTLEGRCYGSFAGLPRA